MENSHKKLKIFIVGIITVVLLILVPIIPIIGVVGYVSSMPERVLTSIKSTLRGWFGIDDARYDAWHENIYNQYFQYLSEADYKELYFAESMSAYHYAETGESFINDSYTFNDYIGHFKTNRNRSAILDEIEKDTGWSVDQEGLSKILSMCSDFSESNNKSYADSGSYGSPAAEPVEGAIAFMVNLAEDNSHGYDQGRRGMPFGYGPGISRYGPDYDCSSAVCTSFRDGGGFSSLPITSTGYMIAAFQQAGNFIWIPAGQADLTAVDVTGGISNLKRGDILLNTGRHTALYLGGGMLAEASMDKDGKPGDSSGQEIWIHNYYNFPWNGVIRYVGS